MAVRLILREHEFAKSLRTQGFPIVILDEKGKIIAVTEAEKRAKELLLPRRPKLLAHFYRSNRGRCYVHVYSLEEGPEEGVYMTKDLYDIVDEGNFEEYIRSGDLEELLGEAKDLALKWILCGEFDYTGEVI